MSRHRWILAAGLLVAAASPAPALADGSQGYLERAFRAGASDPMPSAPARVPAAGGPVAQAASLRWQGFNPKPLPQVGALVFTAADGALHSCSGTVVSRTLILTAAHCVYSVGRGYDQRLVFAPGMRADGSTGVAAPYGTFEARRMWAPAAYVNGDDTADFAFVELAPRVDGALAGDVVGHWGATPNLQWRRGTRIYEAGYPAEGWFATAAGHQGRDAYACDTTMLGYLKTGSSKAVVSRCTMNGGASGARGSSGCATAPGRSPASTPGARAPTTAGRTRSTCCRATSTSGSGSSGARSSRPAQSEPPVRCPAGEPGGRVGRTCSRPCTRRRPPS